MRVFLLAIVLLPVYALAQGQDQWYRSEYYAGIPFWESPIQPFKGEYQISEQEAMKRIHLRLDFDSQNRISEASVRIGNEYKEFEGFFGNLYINAPRTKISYSQSDERHHFFDRFGNRVSVMGNVFEKQYRKDGYGRNVSLTFFAENGQRTSDMFGITSYEWQHQIDGSIIEVRKSADGKIVPLRGSFEFLRTRMIYGPDGQVSVLQNINEQDELVEAPCGAAQFKYIYDSHGRFSRWEVYDREGKKVHGPSGTSGEKNLFDNYYLSDIVFFDSSGNAATHWSGVERWNFEYDEHGNIVCLNYRDASGNPKNAANGYASIHYKWTDDGRFLVSQEYRDANGLLTEHPVSGIAITKYQRNENGLITEVTYLDRNEKKKGRKDNGAALVRYVYRTNGVRTGAQLFDSRGNQVKN